MEEVEAEARGTLDHEPDFSGFIDIPVEDDKEPVFLFESEREEFELKKKKA